MGVGGRAGATAAGARARGVAENTIVLFTSDNGGPTNGNEGTWSSNYPLRGGKTTLFEGAKRWPADAEDASGARRYHHPSCNGNLELPIYRVMEI